jgi:hypothetical protein
LLNLVTMAVKCGDVSGDMKCFCRNSEIGITLNSS